MEILWWFIIALLMLTGWLGTVVPLLPGTVLILCGAVLHRLVFGPENGAGWITIGVLTVLMVLSQALDFLSGSLGAKYFGATRWGAFGAIAGGVIGIFFGIIGLLVGPLAGALIGELLGGRGILPATRSTWGTLLGTGAGLVAKVVIASLMLLWFALSLLA